MLDILECWLNSSTHKAWNQLKYIAARKPRESEPSKPFDIRHGATGIEICHAGLLFCFDPVFANYTLIFPFCNDNLNTYFYVGTM